MKLSPLNHIKKESFTFESMATAVEEDDVVLQLPTTSGVVMQLNGIAESTCENTALLVKQPRVKNRTNLRNGSYLVISRAVARHLSIAF